MKPPRRGPRSRQAVRADINVTPLVDVVLVLLIIFMVVAPIIAQAVPIDLPETVHHESRPDDGQHVVVSVTRTGQIRKATVEEVQLGTEELRARN
jgi:biopolymer transport protein ExbD